MTLSFWPLPWVANLILLVIVGILGLRVTLETIAFFMPQYRPTAVTVDRVARSIALLVARVILGTIVVALTVVVYALLFVELVTRTLLRAARAASARVGVQLPIPLPESPQLARVSVLVSVQGPEPKPTQPLASNERDGSLTSIRG